MFRSYFHYLILPCLAILLVGAYVRLCQAAELELTLKYEGSYDADFTNPVAIDPLNPPTALDATDMHGFSVWLELKDPLPNEDFAGVILDVVKGNGVIPAWFRGGPDYTGSFPQVDPNGSLPPGPLSVFSENLDAGKGNGAHDLARIITFTSDVAASAAAQTGESGPSLLGEFWVAGDVWSVDDETNALVPRLALAYGASAWADPWATYVDGQLEVYGPDSLTYGGFAYEDGTMAAAIVSRSVPEPASLVLASLAALGTLGLVRRH